MSSTMTDLKITYTGESIIVTGLFNGKAFTASDHITDSFEQVWSVCDNKEVLDIADEGVLTSKELEVIRVVFQHKIDIWEQPAEGAWHHFSLIYGTGDRV